jgi:Fe-S-cluster formation regulator IscX/YfhJ
MIFGWNETEKIAKALFEKYPEMPPIVLSKEEIRDMTAALKGVIYLRKQKTDDYALSAIRHSWIKLWHGMGANERMNYTIAEDYDHTEEFNRKREEIEEAKRKKGAWKP